VFCYFISFREIGKIGSKRKFQESVKMVRAKVNGQSRHSLGLIAGLGLLLLISAFGKETSVPAADVNAAFGETWS
jgi:hypothetical protein